MENKASVFAKKWAVLLAVLLGWSGAHRLYVGRVGSAVLQLGLFLAGALLGFESVYGQAAIGFAAACWIMDALAAATGKFCDAYGIPVTEWEGARKEGSGPGPDGSPKD